MGTIRSGLKYFVAGIATCQLLFALPNAAQQTAPTPKQSFDVLSIKQVYPHAGGGGGYTFTSLPASFPCRYQPDRIRCQLTVKGLIEEAYQVNANEVDAPRWTNDQDHWFAIEATMPPGTAKEAARLMLRQGLAERFGLQVHWEKRDTPVYALVPGKHAVKLQPVADLEHPKPRPFTTPSGQVITGSSIFNIPGEFFAAAITMDGLAENLHARAGLERPVVNMTGLTGRYAIDLHWAPPDPCSGPIPYEDPAILMALEKQLGLRLEKRTLPLNVLVVDHVEKAPSPN